MDLKCLCFQGLVQKEVGMLFVVCVWVCVCFLLFSWPLLAETQHIPSKDKFLSIWNFFVGHWTTTPALRHYTHIHVLKNCLLTPTCDFLPFDLFKSSGINPSCSWIMKATEKPWMGQKACVCVLACVCMPYAVGTHVYTVTLQGPLWGQNRIPIT